MTYDFVFDMCANDQQLKYLTAMKEFTGEASVTDVDGGSRGGRVKKVLLELISIQ